MDAASGPEPFEVAPQTGPIRPVVGQPSRRGECTSVSLCLIVESARPMMKTSICGTSQNAIMREKNDTMMEFPM